MSSYVTRDLQVCTGTTGHAEAVKFEYDPEKLNYGDMVREKPCISVIETLKVARLMQILV